MASEVFFHWFTFVLLSRDSLIMSKICLLILPISDFDGLISLNDGEWLRKKTLLLQNSESWVKKTGNENFDVPMGCYDGAELCELVVSFILNKVTSIINKSDIGLYRDDGLRIFECLETRNRKEKEGNS